MSRERITTRRTLELLVSRDVAHPLLVRVRVLTTVVLDHQSMTWIGEVEAAKEVALGIEDAMVDGRFR